MGILLGSVKAGSMTLPEFGVASAIYANCLFLPYVVFAPVLGWLSDRFEKRSVLIFANAVKALGALIGFAGIVAGANLTVLSYLTIGLGAAILSPSKYGILPELRSKAELVKANASVEMTTIFSILTGIIGGSLLVDHIGGRNGFAVLFIVFLVAVLFNILMDRSGIRNGETSISQSLSDFKGSLGHIFRARLLYVPVIGTTIFWSSAFFIKLNLQTWGQSMVKLQTATMISLLALWLSIGIIMGSFIAGKWFKTGQIRQSWLAGFGMGAAVLLIALHYVGYGVLTAELILLGALAGIYLIPLNAEIQVQSNHTNIGKVIATQNLFENGSMLASAGLFWYLYSLSVSPTRAFVITGGLVCLVNVLLLRPLLNGSSKPSSERISASLTK